MSRAASSLYAAHAHALAVYAESLVRDRRVIVIGDATLGLGERLRDLGARSVHVFDPDPARAREAADAQPRGVLSRALPEGDLDVRDGAFDVAIIPDLSDVNDPAALLARVRRVVGPEGCALVSAPNPAAGHAYAVGGPAIEYTELFDLVALQFASVEMIGAVSWRGVGLARLGDEEGDEITVRSELVDESPAPFAFVALASQDPIELDAYAIVQLPSRGPNDDAVPSVVESVNAAEFAEVQLRAELLGAQVQEQRARMANEVRNLEDALAKEREETAITARELESEQRAKKKLELEVALLEEAISGRLTDVETTVTLGGEELAELDDELRAARAIADSGGLITIADVDEHADLVRARLEVQRLELELSASRAENASSHALVENANAQIAEARADAARAARDHAPLVDAHTTELHALESQLRERGRAVTALEQELVRRGKLVEELLSHVEEARANGAAMPIAHHQHTPHEAHDAHGAHNHDREAALAREIETLKQNLDAVALDAARREGELVARGWRIAELERALETVGAPSAKPRETLGKAPDPARIAALEDELDALRTALAQEHQARVLAEHSHTNGDGSDTQESDR